jgi:probable HAF family extracellular repeat protein
MNSFSRRWGVPIVILTLGTPQLLSCGQSGHADGESGGTTSPSRGGSAGDTDAGSSSTPSGARGNLGGEGGAASGMDGGAGADADSGADAGAAGASHGGSWVVADLGPGRCLALNDQGDVLGIDPQNVTFIQHDGGARRSLGVFQAGAAAVGVAIAANGDVAGYSEGPNGRTAIEYLQGAWQAVPGLGSPWSAAIGIGEQGEVAGVSGTQTPGETQAFVVAGGAASALPLPTTRSSAAYLVGVGGRVAGILETVAQQTHAFLISNGTLRDLGTLGGTNSVPLAMNQRGDVVGAAQTSSGDRHAFFVQLGGALRDLGVPAGAVTSEARGVDDHGRIAANAYDAQGLSRPVVFVAGAAPIELLPSRSASPYVSAYVAAMSASGRIVGWGVLRDQVSDVVRCLSWSQP